MLYHSINKNILTHEHKVDKRIIFYLLHSLDCLATQDKFMLCCSCLLMCNTESLEYAVNAVCYCLSHSLSSVILSIYLVLAFTSIQQDYRQFYYNLS